MIEQAHAAGVPVIQIAATPEGEADVPALRHA